MLEKVPTLHKLLAVAVFLLSGPITVFSFLFGGPTAGAIAILSIIFFFVILYIIVVRKYT